MKALNRRNFLRTTASATTGLLVTSGVAATNNLKELSYTNSKKVITRKLGNTGIQIPVLSLGCGGLDSPAIIKAAIKIGISHFDTAYVYQKGNSELILGETLKDYDRKTYTIATKILPQDTEEEFLEKLNTSLKRLQTDYVDILYLHSISSRNIALKEETLNILQKIKESGKAKHIGISTHKNEPEVIQAAIDSNIYEVVLTAINFKQEHHKEIKEKVKLAAKKGIGIVAMKVMAGGYLDKEKEIPVNYKAALKWVLQDKNFHTTIPTMVNLDQIQDNMPVLNDISLTEQEEADLAKASKKSGLYCNACESCLSQCTKHLPIAEIMRAYMYTYGYNSASKGKELLTSMNLNNDPCDGCNICTVNCIKGFNVSAKIKDIGRLTSIPDEFLV